MEIISRQSRTVEPFPVGAFPSKIGEYVGAAAESIGCDPSYIGLPILVTLAGAISNRRKIRIKQDWEELPVLWGAMVGPSGDGKSPALEKSTYFLRRKEWQAAELFNQQMEQYKRDHAEWEAQEQTGNEPQEPVCERFVLGDTTMEALAVVLSKQPNGVVVEADEMAAWFDGMNQYKKRGSDTSNWLSCWNSAGFTIDRKTGDTRTVRVRRTSVSIIGPITPGELQRVLSHEHLENGLAARVLFVMPEPRLRRFSDINIPPGLRLEVEQLFDRLVDLQPERDEDGNLEPVAIGLSSEAKSAFVEFVDRIHEEQMDLETSLRPTWAKMPGHVARFALIFQLASWAAGEEYASQTEIDEASTRDAIALADWFCNEARRVYGALAETDEDRERRELVDLVRRSGGVASARDVMRGSRKRYQTAGAAESALNKLSMAGFGSWENSPIGPKGGRPSRVFRLMPNDNTSTDSEKNEVVCFVPSVTGLPTHEQNGHTSNKMPF
jgi:hypothetical protein